MSDVPGLWNEQLVRDVLGVDADLTLAQPLPLMNEEDKAYWRFTKNGQFTVRSCYWMLRVGGLSSNITENIWKSVWALNAPPKLKHFIWNSFEGQYGSATAIWSKSKFEDLIVEAPTSSFIDRWQWLKNKVSKETLILMAALMWAAWRCRNTKVFENFEPDAVQLAMGYCTYVADYKGYSGRVYERAASSLQKHATKWKCPDMGCVKINVDAHLGEQNRAALGVVCRNHTGQLTSTATKSVPLSSPECVEAQAVRYALLLAQRFGYKDIWVEPDAQSVIKSIESLARGRAPIFSIYRDINILKSSFDKCFFSHVKRVGNTVAHLVARSEVGNAPEVVRFSPFPQSIVTLATLDLSS
ncbi:uncharacterized protein LOC110696717 [Chenopodium quinoa]|uniref:uncharacterized protein LOC110696717 n=1 Tax=Chenopodium quinoa TaxID=63459 RepID=UPI000B78D1FF|nr:uncharacterized protein LOC110696717 [Chenopodium quinoa]